jgi:hypothetical protein
LGWKALNLATGDGNTAIGYTALLNTSSGTANTAVGLSALQSNTTASYNTAVGYQALYLNTTGASNTAVGQGASQGNTSGANNTSVGAGGVLSSNQTGSNNTALGYESQVYTLGSNNTSVGFQSLRANTNGVENTILGGIAGSNINTGSQNTCLGYAAGRYSVAITTGTYNTIIGAYSRTSGAGATHQIVIGADCASIGGDNTVNLGKSGNVIYNSFITNATWTRSSDVRLKKDIQDDTIGLDFINKIKPRTFKWKPSNEVPKELTNHYNEENQMVLDATMNGFIAQEVKEALDAVNAGVQGVWSEQSDGTQAISRELFISPLINAVKELSAQIQELKAEIDLLKGVK